MSSYKTILHVGYPKTGTTSIQQHLFAEHPDVVFLNNVVDLEELTDLILKVPDDKFRRVCGRWQQGIAEIQNTLSRPGVLSREQITDRKPEAIDETVDISTRVVRLGKVFSFSRELPNVSDVSILLVIRRQEDIIVSRFNHSYHHFRRVVGLDDLEDFVEIGLRHPKQGYFSTLNYYRVICEFMEVFGARNVSVLLFEKLREDADAFVQDVCATVGVSGEVGVDIFDAEKEGKRTYKTEAGYIAPNKIYNWLSKLSARVLPAQFHVHSYESGRRLIELLQRLPEFVPGMVPQYISLSDEQRSAIRNHYRDSNRNLQKRLNLPLSRYGYAV